WDEAVAAVEAVPEEQLAALPLGGPVLVVEIDAGRGNPGQARRRLELDSRLDDADDIQARTMYVVATAVVRRAEGDPEAALSAAEAALGVTATLGIGHQLIKTAMVEVMESAFALGRLETLEEL